MIVVNFTGIQGAGKSTLINDVKDILRSEGYMVILMPEEPTTLMSMGLVPGDSLTVLEFQKEILTHCLRETQTINHLVSHYEYPEDTIVLHDGHPKTGMVYLESNEICEWTLLHDKLASAAEGQTVNVFSPDLTFLVKPISRTLSHTLNNNEYRITTNDWVLDHRESMLELLYKDDIVVEKDIPEVRAAFVCEEILNHD